MPRQAHAKTNEKKTPLPSRPRKMPSKATPEEDKHDARDARLALKEAGRKGGVSWEQLKREVGI